MLKKFLPVMLALLLVVSLPVAVFAAWSTSPTLNNAISTATGYQYNPQLVSDGSGGAIITWSDNRSSNYDIYAQRVNAAGGMLWTDNGTAISTASSDQGNPQLVDDGTGGAIITWHDKLSGNWDIYAQRVNASGAALWTANGLAISTASGNQTYPQLIADGAGGAIITWQDSRSGSNYDIYAQRVDASGAALWTANGVAISTATYYQAIPQIVADGAGGAIITWHDYRSSNWDIYAQRVNAAGSAQWTANGLAISTATSSQGYPQLVADGSGGAIITWTDNRSGNYDTYAQRVNVAGSAQWTDNGTAISTANNDQVLPQLVADGAGGAISHLV